MPKELLGCVFAICMVRLVAFAGGAGAVAVYEWLT